MTDVKKNKAEKGAIVWASVVNKVSREVFVEKMALE